MLIIYDNKKAQKLITKWLKMLVREIINYKGCQSNVLFTFGH